MKQQINCSGSPLLLSCGIPTWWGISAPHYTKIMGVYVKSQKEKLEAPLTCTREQGKQPCSFRRTLKACSAHQTASSTNCLGVSIEWMVCKALLKALNGGIFWEKACGTQSTSSAGKELGAAPHISLLVAFVTFFPIARQWRQQPEPGY